MRIASNKIKSVIQFFHTELAGLYSKDETDTLLFYCINGVNGDGTNSGDQPKSDSLLLTPYSPTDIAAFSENGSSFGIFPNPATDILHLTYTLEQPGKVTIQLYTVDAKKAADLLDQTQEAGEQSYTTLLPANLSKGIYFVNLRVNDQMVIRKLLVR